MNDLTELWWVFVGACFLCNIIGFLTEEEGWFFLAVASGSFGLALTLVVL